MDQSNAIAGMLDRETLRGEKIAWVFRWVLYGVFFVLALLVWLVQSSQAGFWGVLGCGACLVYNSGLTLVLRKNRAPRWIRYFSVAVDTGCLTLYNIVDAVYNSALVPVTTATLLVYPVIIFMAALRLDRKLIIYATVLALVATNGVWLGFAPEFDPRVAGQLVSADGWGQLYRSIYLFLFGGLVLFVPQTVEMLLDQQRQMLQTVRIVEDRANHDPLTGLANRAFLLESLRVAVETAQSRGVTGALVYIDLDGFKAVNDTWGHQAGDEILKEVSRRLGLVTRGGDLSARIGGDEFVVLAPELEGEPGAEVMANRILGILCEPWTVQGQPVSIGASAGVVVFPCGVADPEVLLHRADEAMYQAKKTGKGRWTFARNTSS